MDKPVVNRPVLIHSYKHNGLIHRTWDSGFVLEANDDFVITINDKTLVTESDGRHWQTKEPAICCFYKDFWFNVICMIRKNGVYFYCNLASPFVYDGEAIKYIDYDLDVKVFPDYSYKILDEDEYVTHSSSMHYPKVIDDIMEMSMNQLLTMIQRKQGPFAKGFAEHWYQQYLKEESIK